MKEKNFKFRKSFAEVIRVMDDKQAGKFIKALSDYVFDGRQYDGNDTAIKSAFTLVKITLDADRVNQEYGKRGGKKSAELRKEQQTQQTIVRVLASGVAVGEMLKGITDCMEKQSADDDNPSGKGVAK